MTFEQYKTIINTYLDFYPDDKIDIQINDIGLKKCLDKEANGETVTVNDVGDIYSNDTLKIIVYHPEVTLTNDAGKQYTVYGIYVETIFPDCTIYMGRTTYNSKEVAVGYRHSHIPRSDSYSNKFPRMSRFCTGDTTTPINRIESMIREGRFSNFEFTIQSLIIETERMIKIESNEGRPYISFEEVGQSKSSTPIKVLPYNNFISNESVRKKFRLFIDYYCSLGLDDFYFDGRNWQLKATDAEFIKRVSKAAKLYKPTKNLSIFQEVYEVNGLYYDKSQSSNYIASNTHAEWTFKGEHPLLKVVDNDNVKVSTTTILKKEYLETVYNYLLNLINGVYANKDKYKDSIHSRAYKIKTALIQKCGI